MGFTDKHWLRNLLLGLAIGGGTMALLIAALLLSEQLSFQSFSPSALLVPDYWLYLVVFVFVAIGEETFARGFLCTVLKPSRQKWFIVLFPSLCFAAMHLFNSGIAPVPFLNLFLGGVWFCLLFVRSGSLWLSIGTHFAWNFFQGQIFGTQVSGNETPSLLVFQQTGSNPLFTGGAFGPEGSLLSTGVLLAFILVLLFAVKTSPNASWTFESGLPFVKNKKAPMA